MSSVTLSDAGEAGRALAEPPFWRLSRLLALPFRAAP
jgi:hypothetical protein